MKDKIAYFAFYESFEKMLDFLDDEEQLRFYKAIIAYGLHGIEPEFSGKDLALFSQIKFAIDRQHSRSITNSNNRKSAKDSEPKETEIEEMRGEEGAEVEREAGGVCEAAPGEKPPESHSDAGISKKRNEIPKKPPLLEREPANGNERVEKAYLENYETLRKKGFVSTASPIIDFPKVRRLENEQARKFGFDTVLECVRRSAEDEFCVNSGYSLQTILSTNVLNRLANGGKRGRGKAFGTGNGVDALPEEFEIPF